MYSISIFLISHTAVSSNYISTEIFLEYGLIPVLILLSVFGIKIIPDSLKKCPHGISGGITREKCPKCNEAKLREELREKWRDDDSRKLWEIFDEENEKRLFDEAEQRLQKEKELRNQFLWDEEKKKLEVKADNQKKKILETNQVIWDREIGRQDEEDWKSLIVKEESRRQEIIIEDDVEPAGEYNWEARNEVWSKISNDIRQKSFENLTADDLFKKEEIKKTAEKIFQEEYDKINYLKQKKYSYLKSLPLKGFEKSILDMFKKLGYVNRTTTRQNDAGKIIVLYKHSYKYLLLCKKYPENCQINVPDVEKLAMAIANQRAAGGFLVSTCQFSRPAFQIAKESKIEPVDVYLLTKMLNEAYPVTYDDERIRVVCLECGEIVYFNLFDYRESITCKYGHEVSNLVFNRSRML